MGSSPCGHRESDMTEATEHTLLYDVIVILTVLKNHISSFVELLSCNNLIVITLKHGFPNFQANSVMLKHLHCF